MKATTGSYEIRIDRALLSSTHTFMRNKFNKKTLKKQVLVCLDIHSNYAQGAVEKKKEDIGIAWLWANGPMSPCRSFAEMGFR